MDSKPADGPDSAESTLRSSATHTETVPLNEINSDDVFYRITTRQKIDDLLDSILSLGLLHPPVLVEKKGAYSIVCGFRRIAACRKLGWKTVTAAIHKAGTDRMLLAQQAIADNALQRPLNLVETSRALNLMGESIPDRQQLKKAALSMGLPVNSAAASKILKVCRLPQSIQEGILSETYDLAMALKLGELRSSDSAAMVDFFTQLKVGLNRQRELLLLISEIASSEDVSIRHIITEKPLQELLQNIDTDRAILRQNVRSYLRQRRFPAISRTEAEYRKQVTRLKLGKHIQLIPPRDFEGTTYAMTLFFQNQKELYDHKEKIEQILEHPALGEILKR